jgi:enoyl-CoA hydratase
MAVLRTERDNGVLILTLDRPSARNALDPELTEALADALGQFARDPDLVVAVLTGSDPAFCAGLDMHAYGDATADRSRVSAVLRAVGESAKPLIAAVNGPAVTGGLELALACDWIVASERAVFADTHSRIGAFPGSGLSARLPEAVGVRLAKAMSLAGYRLDAERAVRAGLAVSVVPHDDLLPTALEMARDIATRNPALVQAIRTTYDAAVGVPTSTALAAEEAARAAWRSGPGAAISWPQAPQQGRGNHARPA